MSHLKNPEWPAEAASWWSPIFGNPRPVRIEIGPGRGEHLRTCAQAQPEVNVLGIERSPRRAAELLARVCAAGLKNARVLSADAACATAILPDRSVFGYVIQFPDPWWKRRHRRRRVFTPALVATMIRTLTRGGRIEFVSDVPDYFILAQNLLDAQPELERCDTGVHKPLTTFARKAASRGTPIYSSLYRKR